jgi:hypothetical protein
VGWRGLTETKEGRLVVIAAVTGTLMILVAVGNLMAAGAADEAADRARAALRRELAAVSDEMIAGYPTTRAAIEEVATAAVAGERGRVLGSSRLDDHEITVAVQSGFAWQVRCIEVELRGDAVVLTYVRPRPC